MRKGVQMKSGFAHLPHMANTGKWHHTQKTRKDKVTFLSVDKESQDISQIFENIGLNSSDKHLVIEKDKQVADGRQSATDKTEHT